MKTRSRLDRAGGLSRERDTGPTRSAIARAGVLISQFDLLLDRYSPKISVTESPEISLTSSELVLLRRSHEISRTGVGKLISVPRPAPLSLLTPEPPRTPPRDSSCVLLAAIPWRKQFRMDLSRDVARLGRVSSAKAACSSPARPAWASRVAWGGLCRLVCSNEARPVNAHVQESCGVVSEPPSRVGSSRWELCDSARCGSRLLVGVAE